MKSYSPTIQLVVSEWNGFVNGSLVTTALLLATVISGIAAAMLNAAGKAAPYLPTEIIGGLTLLWVLVSLPLAILRAVDKQRVRAESAESATDAANTRRN